MFIKTKLTEKDFIRANFILVYSKISTKIFYGLFLLAFLFSLLGTFYLHQNDPFSVFFLLLILAVRPVSLYFTAKRNYVSNQRIGETIEYTFDETYLTIKGESFSSQYTWDKVYKVSRVKDIVFIWQSRQTASIIPSRDIWEGEIADIKTILDKQGVQNNL